MLHTFICSLARSKYLPLFPLSLIFHSVFNLNPKIYYMAGLLIFNHIHSGLLARIRWSVCISKSQRILCIPWPRRDSDLWHLVVWSNFNYLAKLFMLFFSPWEFFTSALAGLSQEFEWQQVFSKVQESSKYSGRSQ